MRNVAASMAACVLAVGLAAPAAAEEPMTRAEIVDRLPPTHIAELGPSKSCVALIADIKSRGVSFQPNMADGSTMSAGCDNFPETDIYSAVTVNYGARPDVAWFVGGWRLAGLGAPLYSGPATSFFMPQDASAAAESGQFQINADGSYILQLSDAAKPLRGSWRRARDEERARYYGGDALVLLKAESGNDWLVSKYGLPDRDEIDVLDLKLRGAHRRYGDR